jgi:hypothetical protein
MADPEPSRRARAPRPLSARDVRFCRLYAERGTRHGYGCYLEAGFPERATRTATSSAMSRLLRRPEVRATIRDLRAAAADAARVTVEELARGFRRAERADVTRLFGPDGEMLPPARWPEDVRLCVTRFEVEDLFETADDPDQPGRKKRVATGRRWKVWFENKTECRKVLAAWLRMTGGDAGPPAAPGGHTLVVIKGPAAIPAPRDEPGAPRVT